MTTGTCTQPEIGRSSWTYGRLVKARSLNFMKSRRWSSSRPGCITMAHCMWKMSRLDAGLYRAASQTETWLFIFGAFYLHSNPLDIVDNKKPTTNSFLEGDESSRNTKGQQQFYLSPASLSQICSMNIVLILLFPSKQCEPQRTSLALERAPVRIY